MSNIGIWDKLKTPPPWAVKPITGGRLSGKSDINPQWRYMAMTEQFGPCGIGWKYEVIKKWTEQGSDNQIMAFVDILVYVKINDKWSDPIPGSGGAFLIEKESKGLHSNDEAFKMATTDALSVALKMIGVGADIYCGEAFSKYDKKPELELTQEEINKQHYINQFSLFKAFLTDNKLTTKLEFYKKNPGLISSVDKITKEWEEIKKALAEVDGLQKELGDFTG